MNKQRLSKALPEIAKKLSINIEHAALEKLGFALIIFPSEDEGQMQYIGNTDRRAAMEALEQLLLHWKSGTPDVPEHLRH